VILRHAGRPGVVATQPHKMTRAVHILLAAAGAAVVAGSLVFATPVFHIAPFTAPARCESLPAGGLYAIVRRPLSAV
jgi:hypothetical protein